jgi:hypothetical protein
VLEQPVYFVLVPDARWLLEGVVLARWLVLGALLLEFAWVLWGASLKPLALARRYAPAVLSILVGLGLVIAIPALGRSYAGQRLNEDPAASLISYLATEQARAETEVMLVSDQDFLRRAKPYLGRHYELRLAGGDRLYPTAPTVTDLVADSEKVWVFTSGQDAGRVEQSLEAQGSWLLTYDFAEEGELRLYATRGDLAFLPPVARLANGANLVGYSVERLARDQLQITLYWWALVRPRQSYTVFTQVLDAEGDLVAGQDGFPVNGSAPTQSWTEGRVYVDTHVIQLPGDLPRGTYRLVTGMYDFNGVRVVATGPGATIFDAKAVPLGEIRLR